MNKKVIIYDDENIEYFTGCMGDCRYEPIYVNGEITPIAVRQSFDITDINRTDTIQLDKTLMRRIAKYNKEKECQQLDEKIKEKKAKIEELDDILTDRVGRVEKLKEFIAKIYDIDLYDDDYIKR